MHIITGYDYMGTIQKGRDSTGRVLDLTLVPFTQQLLQQAQQAGQSYQYAVVLGGINDLGNANQSAAAIFPKLVQVRAAGGHEFVAALQQEHVHGHAMHGAWGWYG